MKITRYQSPEFDMVELFENDMITTSLTFFNGAGYGDNADWNDLDPLEKL